jgi:hypothetical protein
MITCDFFGGLGNNLFQLATVYNIHKKYNYELRIPTFSQRNGIERYGQSNVLELNELFENKFFYDDSLINNLPKYIHPDVNLNSTDYTVTKIPISDNTCYSGYFQSEKYFNDININKEFIISTEKKSHIQNKYKNLFLKKNISLHYRLGGDRITSMMQHYHKNVSPEYYKSALDLISDYNENDYNVLVFTDNRNLAENLLSGFKYNFIYIDNNNDNIIDFIMMSMCDINIIGNSTFSWWSAYMNSKENKKVIATKTEWFGPGYKHFNLTDTFPKDWITL